MALLSMLSQSETSILKKQKSICHNHNDCDILALMCTTVRTAIVTGSAVLSYNNISMLTHSIVILSKFQLIGVIDYKFVLCINKFIKVIK